MADGEVTLPEITIVGTPWYDTIDAAALDAMNDIVATSISEGVEYSGLIIKLGNGKFNYEDPVTEHSANSSPFDMKPPTGTTVVGFYHTHPVVGTNWSNFSAQDIGIASAKGVVLYLATNIQMKKLTPPKLLSGADKASYGWFGKMQVLRSYPPIQP